MNRGFCFLLLLLMPWITPPQAAAADPAEAGRAFIGQDANLRTSPSENAAIITPLPQGTEVLIQVRHKEWIRVEAPGLAKTGWVHAPLVSEEPHGPAARQESGTGPAAARKIIAAEERKIVRKKTAAAQPAPAPAPLIGVIDIQQVIDRSQRGMAARERFEALRRAGQTADLDRAEKEIISAVIVEIRAIVEAYARAKGFTHILNSNTGTLFYNDSSFDITDDIIRDYDRQAALPQQPQ
jgi:hypothetical protein